MGCSQSKTGPGAEVVVSAALVSKHLPGKPASDHGSDIKSMLSSGGKPDSLASKDATPAPSAAPSAPSSHGPVMMCDCRAFDGEQQREDAVRALGVVDTPVDDPRFNAISKLMASIFQTPVALITLITEDRVWFKSKVGPFGACVTREGSWCNYISVPNTPEVLITEDASEDARFAANPYVAGAPFIKFYAGAPLVGKNGMRYGTLCVVDLKRRSFSAEMYALLINFANLVVQELERDAASMREVAAEAAATAAGQHAIQRMLASAHTGVALVDVRSRTWPLLYANSAFARDEGGDSAEACTTAGGLWSLFELADAADPEGAMRAIDAAVAAGHATRTTLASRRTGRRVSVVLRPGDTDQLRPNQAIGIPSWVPSEKVVEQGCHAGALPGALDAGGARFEGPAGTTSAPAPTLASCFWFVELEGTPVSSAATSRSRTLTAPATPTAGGGARGAAPGRAHSDLPLQNFSSKRMPDVLTGLEMGPMIGSGSYGRVYRGFWRDEVVAVKLIDCCFTSQAGSASAAELALHEAELSKSLQHPCVVKTLEYAMMGTPADGGGTLWMIQQMCNHGTLIEAVDRGWVRKKRSLTAPPSMPAVLRTLREVAAGMAFLHSRDVMHCDLTGNNVLLEAAEPSEDDDRGFRARVGDFGLARVAAGDVSTASFGTCSHMAPELMTDGLLTRAADVWSFGVIAWEVYCGVRAFVGHRMPNIIFLVTSGRGELRLPPGTPPGYRALVEACLQWDHTLRPSFEQLVERIDALLEARERVVVAPPPPPTSLGPCKASADLAAAAAASAAQQLPLATAAT